MNHEMTQTIRFYVRLALFILAALAIAHIAVVTTTGASWTNPIAGADALAKALGLHGSGDPDVKPVNAATGLVAGGGLLGLLIAFMIVSLKGASSSVAPKAGVLASAEDINRSVAPKKKDLAEATSPIAYRNGVPIRQKREDNGAVVGAPRSGKTMRLVLGLIVDAPGAVVTSGTKPEIYRLTAWIRARIGKIYVFDVEAISPWRRKMKWDIVAGCEDGEVADERAEAIVAARPLGKGGNSEFFAEATSTVLRTLMHAAALKPGGNMRDVLRWAHNFDDDEPYNILRDHPGAMDGWRDELMNFCRGEAGETTSSTTMTLNLALKCFSTPRILDAVCPRPKEGFDAGNHYRTKDTLYLLARSGKKSRAAAVNTALLSTIDRSTRLAAGHTASGRLEPVVTYVLDEVANGTPIPDLPSIMSDGGGRGVVCWIFVQSRQQLAERYGKEDAKTILDSASCFLMLSGSKDFEHLRELSNLIGKTTVSHVSTTSGTNSGSSQVSTKEVDLLPPERIRTLGLGKALMLYRDQAATVVDLIAWWERPDATNFEQSLKWALNEEGITTTNEQVTGLIEGLMQENTDEEPVALLPNSSFLSDERTP